jgi:hypothetical protein
MRHAPLLFAVWFCVSCSSEQETCDQQRNILGMFIDASTCGDEMEEEATEDMALEGGFEDGFSRDTGLEGGDAEGEEAEATVPEGGDASDSDIMDSEAASDVTTDVHGDVTPDSMGDVVSTGSDH